MSIEILPSRASDPFQLYGHDDIAQISADLRLGYANRQLNPASKVEPSNLPIGISNLNRGVEVQPETAQMIDALSGSLLLVLGVEAKATKYSYNLMAQRNADSIHVDNFGIRMIRAITNVGESDAEVEIAIPGPDIDNPFS